MIKNKYLPYMQAILHDLKLPNNLNINLYFENYTTYFGRAKYYTDANYGFISISRYLHHDDIVVTLMHELEHIRQYYSGDLVDIDDESYWKGIIYPRVNYSKKNAAKYDLQPWEIAASAYEQHVFRLFPAYQLKRIQVGQTQKGTKVYRYAKN